MDRIPSADAWEHPLILRALSPTVRERVVRLWADREALLAALDSLPHTFCHRDAFRPNLFLRRDADGHKQTVAIDWAFAGAGPVGEEIAPLIAMRPAGGLEPYDPASLERSVFTGYLRGLREAGWRGDERLVRFGYAATAALRYTFLTVAEMQSEAFDESRYAEVERRRGRPIEVVMGRQAALVSYLLGLADEARALLAFVAVGTAPKDAAAGAARAGSRRGPASGGQARNGVERTEQVPATRN